jgi:hypothetical protein
MKQHPEDLDRLVATRDHARPNVELRIERLVLDGVHLTGMQAVQMRIAMQIELTRLLADGLPHPLPSGATSRLRASDLLNFDSSNSSEMGRRVGRSVYESLISYL